jgi:hypothetical protein
MKGRKQIIRRWSRLRNSTKENSSSLVAATIGTILIATIAWYTWSSYQKDNEDKDK